MCGVHYLGGQRFEIFCELIDPFWWKHPDPVIDFSRLVFDRLQDGPHVDPWRGELTEISRILGTAVAFQDRELGDRLGSVAAELGNAIAERAGVDARFEWTTHEAA